MKLLMKNDFLATAWLQNGLNQMPYLMVRIGENGRETIDKSSPNRNQGYSRGRGQMIIVITPTI
jgi:hypothetical protein